MVQAKKKNKINKWRKAMQNEIISNVWSAEDFTQTRNLHANAFNAQAI